MVGWIPSNPLIRAEKAAEFLNRVADSQDFGSLDVPLILTYDDRQADMRPYLWPTERGIPVRPDALDEHRHTHHFLAPSCPCAYKEGKPYTETKIGLAQTVNQPSHSTHCLGQFVAICATQKCSYFVALERYFSHPHLMKHEYPKREQRIKSLDSFLFITDDTEETIKKTGLRQMHILNDKSNSGLRGTNKLLKREDPESFLKMQTRVKSLAEKGLPAEEFWDLFIQCAKCKYVMPGHYFPYYHSCVVNVVHSHLGLIAPTLPDFSPSSDFDEDDLPGPAQSDDALRPGALLAIVSAKRQASDPADPVTPKKRSSSTIGSV